MKYESDHCEEHRSYDAPYGCLDITVHSRLNDSEDISKCNCRSYKYCKDHHNLLIFEYYEGFFDILVSLECNECSCDEYIRQCHCNIGHGHQNVEELSHSVSAHTYQKVHYNYDTALDLHSVLRHSVFHFAEVVRKKSLRASFYQLLQRCIYQCKYSACQ